MDPGINGLAPGQSATIDVTSQLTVDAGISGSLVIDSNGGLGTPVVIPLAVYGS